MLVVQLSFRFGMNLITNQRNSYDINYLNIFYSLNALKLNTF